MQPKASNIRFAALGFVVFLRASQDLAYILFLKNFMKKIFCISLESNYF